MTFHDTNYPAEAAGDTPAQVTRPDAGKTSGEMVDYLYQELRKRSLIEYGSVIDVELIREIVDLPEPNIHGLAPKEIRKMTRSRHSRCVIESLRNSCWIRAWPSSSTVTPGPFQRLKKCMPFGRGTPIRRPRPFGEPST